MRFGGNDLIHTLSLIHHGLHPIPNRSEHVPIRPQISGAADLAVSGDDHRCILRHLQHAIRRSNDAFDVAPGVNVDERIHAVEEDVTHVEDVGLREMDDGVSIRVGISDVKSADLFAVPVKRDFVGERDLGPGTRWRGLGAILS